MCLNRGAVGLIEAAEAIFYCRSTTVGTCSTTFDPPSVRFAYVLTYLKYVFIRLDGRQKGSTGYHERFVRTYRLLNEVSPAGRPQLATAVCTEQHQNLDGGSLRW